jgi:ERF superfamily
MEQNILPEISEKSDVILKQLMAAKAEMGSIVRKDSKNPFHKSNYASLGAHLDLSESVLAKHGLIMVHSPNLFNEQPILIATLRHPESGQWLKAYLPLPNPKADSQGIGASITYMRRYSINSMLGLTAEDDDAESACLRDKKPQPAKVTLPKEMENPKMNPQQVKTLKALESQLNNACKVRVHDWMRDTYKTTEFAEIPEEFFAKVCSCFENALKFMKDQEKVVA